MQSAKARAARGLQKADAEVELFRRGFFAAEAEDLLTSISTFQFVNTASFQTRQKVRKELSLLRRLKNLTYAQANQPRRVE